MEQTWIIHGLWQMLGFPDDSVVKNPPASVEMQEMWVPSLGREDPLEEEVATHSSILAGEIPWTEKPGVLQSTGLQRVKHDWATEHTGMGNIKYSSLSFLLLSYYYFLNLKAGKQEKCLVLDPAWIMWMPCPLFVLLIWFIPGPDGNPEGRAHAGTTGEGCRKRAWLPRMLSNS